MKIPFYFSDLQARAGLFRACTVLIDENHFVCNALMDVYQRGNLDASDFIAAEAYIQDCLKSASTVGERLTMDGLTIPNWTVLCYPYRREWCWNISRKLDGEPYETEFDTEKVYV